MILSCGDALIDFVPVVAADRGEAVRPMVGGSCLNVAIGLARLGAPAGFVGGMSTDLFGHMIAEHAEASGVDLRYCQRSARPTTLAFVRTVEGEARYAFYDEGSAARHWSYRPGSLPFADIDAIHIGSTTLVDAAASAETLRLVEDAGGSTTLSFDPNCRPNLVGDKAGYARRMEEFAARAGWLYYVAGNTQDEIAQKPSVIEIETRIASTRLREWARSVALIEAAV